MPIWLWLVLPVAAFVMLRGAPLRVAGEPQRVGDSGELEQGQVDVVREDKWRCDKKSKQPVPNLGALVPKQLQLTPIGATIVGGTAIVKAIFEAVGPAKFCTVLGGLYKAVVVYDRLPARHMTVWIEPMYGGAPAGQWTFSTAEGDARTDTGEVPLVDKLVEPSPRQQYLMNGGQPPGDLWPHVNLGTYRASVPPELDEPRVELVRSGDQLTLYVWLPPRAPRSELGVWGQYKVLHPVTWRISWALG